MSTGNPDHSLVSIFLMVELVWCYCWWNKVFELYKTINANWLGVGLHVVATVMYCGCNDSGVVCWGMAAWPAGGTHYRCVCLCDYKYPTTL